MKFLIFTLASFLCCSLGAQRTWVVDCAGSPSSDFSDLPPAIAAAAPGDTIVLVTRTTCSVFRSAPIDKPLRIVTASIYGGPGVPGLAAIQGRLSISNIPAGSSVVISNIAMNPESITGPPYVVHGIEARNCAGAIHLESTGYGTGYYTNSILRFENCADVTLKKCSIYIGAPALTFVDSNATLTDCDLTAFPPHPLGPPWASATTSEALSITNSNVTLVRTFAQGASRWGQTPPRPTVLVNSGTLTLGPHSTLIGGIETQSTPQVIWYAMQVPSTGTGQVFVDPRSSHTGFWPGSRPAIIREAPSLAHSPLIRNENYTVDVFGFANGLALLGGGSALLSPVPTPIGDLSIDPCGLLVLGLMPGGSGRFTFFCPPQLPLGHLFMFQAAVMNPRGGAVSLTVPSRFVVSWETGRIWP